MKAVELALQTPIMLLEELLPLFQSAVYKRKRNCLIPKTCLPIQDVLSKTSLTPMWEVVGGCLLATLYPLLATGLSIPITQTLPAVQQESSSSISSNTSTNTNTNTSTNDAQFHHYIVSACDNGDEKNFMLMLMLRLMMTMMTMIWTKHMMAILRDGQTNQMQNITWMTSATSLMADQR